MISQVTHPTIANVLSTDDKWLWCVPRYQREYTWGKRNWEQLLDDVLGNDPGYFLGSVIVIPGPLDTTTGILEYEVIDGQQRLVTVSLLLAAIYERLCSDDLKPLVDEDLRAEELVPLRNRLVLKTDKTRTRVIPQVQNHNLEDFRWVMHEVAGLKAPDDKPKNFGNRRIAKAFAFFREQVGERVADLDAKAVLARLLAMRNLVLAAVVVQIDVDSHADAYTLFASLNDRGTPLSAVDLVKNVLFSQLTREDEGSGAHASAGGIDLLYGQWQAILAHLGDDYATQERFFRQCYDAFRREANADFATPESALPLGSVATRSNLLDIYEKRIRRDAAGVLGELERRAPLYGRIIGTEKDAQGAPLDAALLDLSRAQGVPGDVLLLRLMERKDALGLSDELLVRIVRLLARFFVRRNLTNTPPTYTLERLFATLCEEVEDGGLCGEDVLQHVRQRLVGVSADGATFRARLSGPIYEDNRDMARYVLAAIANTTKETRDLWERKGGQYVWTIEHVFPEGRNIPQAWVDMMGGGDSARAQEVQERQVHRLGNLTLSAYNSRLFTKPFLDKRDLADEHGNFIGYRNGLSLNADLAKADTWSERAIEERTQRLVDAAMETFEL